MIGLKSYINKKYDIKLRLYQQINHNLNFQILLIEYLLNLGCLFKTNLNLI